MKNANTSQTTAQTTALLLLYMLSAPASTAEGKMPAKTMVIPRSDNKPIKRKPEWFVPNSKYTSPVNYKPSPHGGR